jgi:hypothetical protein
MSGSRWCDVNSERRRGRATLALAALLTAMAVAGAGCDFSAPTPEFTAVPIGVTPYPHGTTGQYGLHIDPALLAKLPHSVSAQPLVEAADLENIAMDDPDLAKTFDAYAAAEIGAIGDNDWLYVAIGHFKADPQSDAYPDAYAAWVGDYAAGSCSQANGVSDTSQETINDWIVDVANCRGGPTVYSLSLGGGVVLSMFGAGPRGLGRKLIEALY